MRFYVNRNTNAVTQDLYDRSHQASGWVAKVEASEQLEIQFHRDGVPELLPANTPLLWGSKAHGQYTSPQFLTSVNTFTVPTDASGFYTAGLPTNTIPLNAALGSTDGGATPGNTPSLSPTDCEIDWWLAGLANPPTKSQTFSVEFDNTPVRGTDAAAQITPSFSAAQQIPVNLASVTKRTGAANDAAALANVVTVGRAAGTLFSFTEANTGTLVFFRLTAGAATAGDSNQVAPADYDAATNAVHFVLVPTGGGTSGVQPLVRTAVKSANYPAVPGDAVPVDTGGSSVAVTLPTAPANGSRVAVKLISQNVSNTATVLCGSGDVFNKTGGATSAALLLLNQGLIFEYDAATKIWTIYAGDLPLSGLDARFATAAQGAKADAAAIDTAVVHLAGAETIAGQKTFTLAPIFSSGTAGTLLGLDANKNVVSKVAGSDYLTPYGSGANLTALNAANVSSGTLADARLSANVPLKNANNTFATAQTFQAATSSALVAITQQAAWGGTQYALQVSGYTSLGGMRINGADGAAALYLAGGQLGFTTDNGQPITFTHYTGGFVERMRIAPSGGVNIGGTADVAAGNLVVAGTIKRGVYTVGTLPSASTVGAGTDAFVSDSNTVTFNAVVAGGGTYKVPVCSDGTNWRVN